MKTAHEWSKELGMCDGAGGCTEVPRTSVTDIVKIQLEAYQLGIEHSRDPSAVMKQCDSFVNQIIDNTAF